MGKLLESIFNFGYFKRVLRNLREIYEVEEGLENRLLGAAVTARNFKEFMEKVKTKRYTWTRLQRICVHILTNTKKSEMLPSRKKRTIYDC